MKAPVLFSTLLIAACGGGSGSGGTPTTITLDTSGPPNLVAFKLGTGDWQVLEPDGNLYELVVDEPYVVAVACNDFVDLFDTYMFARTPEDDPEISAPCTGMGPALDGRVQGTFAQAGDVSIGFTSQTIATPGDPFDLDASNGTHEIIALTDTAIAIRRGVEVAGVTQLAIPLDVAEGAALVPASFTTNAALDESTFGFVRIFTEHGTSAFMFTSGDLSALLMAPDDVLAAVDFQSVNISASTGDLTRSAFIDNARADTERSITLPEHLSDVTLTETGGTISAEWGDLPDHDSLSVSVDQTIDSVFLFHDLQISPAYADEMGTSIVLDLDIPGFDPGGNLDVTAAYNRSFAASKGRDGLRVSSQVNEAVNQPSGKRSRLALKKTAIANRYLSRK